MDHHKVTDTRKSGMKWLLPIILLLLLLGLLAWYALSDKNDDKSQSQNANTAENRDNENATTPRGDAAAGTITSIGALLAVDKNAVSSNMRVDMPSVMVAEVVNDRVFTVGESGDVRFALLAEQLDEGEAESQIQVQAGQTVSVKGKIVKVPADTAQLVEQYQLTEAHAQMLAEDGYYVLVEEISMQ